MARLDLTAFCDLTPPKFITRRKGMEVVWNVLDAALRTGTIKPYECIWVRRLEKVLEKNKLTGLWNRNPNRKDNNGLLRTLGDLLGGHGMQLRRKSAGCFIMPHQLPEIKGDYMIKPAVYHRDE